MAVPDDFESQIAIMRKVMDQHQAGQSAEVTMSPFEAWLLVAVVQGAVREPSMTGHQRDLLRQLGRRIAGEFFPDGSAERDVLETGWHPDFDVR